MYSLLGRGERCVDVGQGENALVWHVCRRCGARLQAMSRAKVQCRCGYGVMQPARSLQQLDLTTAGMDVRVATTAAVEQPSLFPEE